MANTCTCSSLWTYPHIEKTSKDEKKHHAHGRNTIDYDVKVECRIVAQVCRDNSNVINHDCGVLRKKKDKIRSINKYLHLMQYSINIYLDPYLILTLDLCYESVKSRLYWTSIMTEISVIGLTFIIYHIHSNLVVKKLKVIHSKKRTLKSIDSTVSSKVSCSEYRPTPVLAIVLTKQLKMDDLEWVSHAQKKARTNPSKRGCALIRACAVNGMNTVSL